MAVKATPGAAHAHTVSSDGIMNKKNIIPVLIALMSASLVGIIAAQVYWIKETYWLTQRRIDTEIMVIMETALQHTETEHATNMVAEHMGIDPSKPLTWANKRDSLARLKYFIDSMELCLAEAELNQKLGVTEVNFPAPLPPIKAPAPKAAPKPKPAVTPQVKVMAPQEGRAPDPVVASTDHVDEVNNHLAKGGNPMDLDGRIITLPDGRRVKVEVEPYARASVGLESPYGRFQATDGYSLEPFVNRFGMEVPLTTMPNYWYTNIDSMVKAQKGLYLFSPENTTRKSRKKRQVTTTITNPDGTTTVEVKNEGQEIKISTSNDNPAEIIPLKREEQLTTFAKGVMNRELAKARRANRAMLKHLNVGGLSLAKYIDSMTKRQLELAYEAARAADSVAQLRTRYYLHEAGVPNDVLKVGGPGSMNLLNGAILNEGASRTAAMRGRGASGSYNNYTYSINSSAGPRFVPGPRTVPGPPVVPGPPAFGANPMPQMGYGLGAASCAPAEMPEAPEAPEMAELPERPEQVIPASVSRKKSRSQAKTTNTLLKGSMEAVPAVAPQVKLGTVSEALSRLLSELGTAEDEAMSIDLDEIKASIARGLKEHEMEMPFEVAIIDTRSDSVRATLASTGWQNENINNAYKVCMYPNSANSNLFLSLYLPNKGEWLIHNLGWSLGASLVFMFIIIGVFVAGILTIIRQKRLATIKSDFISNMTHELKTPLATISLAADTLNYQNIYESPDKIKYFTGIIKEENQRMNGHIERVLQMALLDKDEYKLKKKELNLVELVLEQGEMLCLNVTNKGGQLHVDFDEDEIPVLADKLQIQSVLTNLVDNAVKYCHQAPNISIKLFTEAGQAVMTVQDNGIGISSKAQRKIFDRFYRVTQGDLHEVKGFGLGLSFVKAITEAHQGSVEVESTPNVGSTFTIRLPLYTSAESNIHPS